MLSLLIIDLGAMDLASAVKKAALMALAYKADGEKQAQINGDEDIIGILLNDKSGDVVDMDMSESELLHAHQDDLAQDSLKDSKDLVGMLLNDADDSAMDIEIDQSPKSEKSDQKKILKEQQMLKTREIWKSTLADKMVKDIEPEKGYYHCPEAECNAKYTTKENLRTHVCKHTGERPFACDLPGCDSTFTNPKELRNHKKSHQDPKNLLKSQHAAQTAIIWQKTKAYLKVKDVKINIKGFYCCPESNCVKKYKSKPYLQVHMCDHTGELPFVCDVEGCLKNFKDPVHLRKHKKEHKNGSGSSSSSSSNDMDSSQSKVGYSSLANSDETQAVAQSSEPQDIIKMLLNEGNEKTQDMDSYESKKESSIKKITENIWRSTQAYQRTKNLKADEQGFVTCPEINCGTKLKRLYNIKLHMCDHTGELPFVCEFEGCSKRFKTPSNLNDHKKAHNEHDIKKDKFFVCDFPDCPKIFKLIESLNQHKKKHTGSLITKNKQLWKNTLAQAKAKNVKPNLNGYYDCPEVGCNKSFMNRNKLREHLCKHTGELPLSCHKFGCAKRFYSAGLLAEHMKSCHLVDLSNPVDMDEADAEAQAEHIHKKRKTDEGSLADEFTRESEDFSTDSQQEDQTSRKRKQPSQSSSADCSSSSSSIDNSKDVLGDQSIEEQRNQAESSQPTDLIFQQIPMPVDNESLNQTGSSTSS